MSNYDEAKAKRIAELFRDAPLPEQRQPQAPIQDDSYDNAYKRMLENSPDPVEQKRQELQAQNMELERQKARLANMQPAQPPAPGMSADIAEDGMTASPYVGSTPAYENLRKKLLNR